MYRQVEPYEYYVNILFMDSKYDLISTLVDQKASIIDITIPSNSEFDKVDTTVKNIGYLIAFEDSNKDKIIDRKDNYDLYISDLAGKMLTKVTTNIDINSFEFINNHQNIFISFTDRQDIPVEHKITRFAIYNLQSKDLKYLTSLDKAMTNIQKILNK